MSAEHFPSNNSPKNREGVVTSEILEVWNELNRRNALKRVVSSEQPEEFEKEGEFAKEFGSNPDPAAIREALVEVLGTHTPETLS